MTNRRELLQFGITASVVSFLPAFTLASSAPLLVRKPVYKILYDTRFHDSEVLARGMPGVLGVTPTGFQSLDGDITRFWTRDMSAVWRESAQAVAGVTGERVLFCLAQLAREKHLRVVWQIDHDDCQLYDPATGASEKLVSWLITQSAFT